MKVFPKISILKTYKRKFTLGGKMFLNAGVKFNFKFCSTRLYFEVEYLALISRFYLFFIFFAKYIYTQNLILVYY